MEDNLEQEKTETEYIRNNPINKKKEVNTDTRQFFDQKIRFYLTILFIFFGTAFIGFIVANSLKKEEIILETQSSVQSNIIPSNLAVLKNHAFTNWTARVKGKIRNVSDGDIEIMPIVEKFLENGKRDVSIVQGESTKILVVPNITNFFESKPASNGASVSSIKIKSIKEGRILDGSVGISYENNNYRLYGEALTIRD